MIQPITHVITCCILCTLFLLHIRSRIPGLFTICLLLFSLPLSSQQREVLKHYSTEQGLSHDGVLCITRDKDGFMWFGTWDGLNKFDGNTFTIYKSYPGDSSSLTNNKFRNIIEDKKGYLWVKTYDHNVYRFDKNTGKFLAINRRNNVRSLNISRIFLSDNGSAWLTTADKGLLHVVFSPSKSEPAVHHYTKSARAAFKLPSDSINFFFEDNQTNAWVGTTAGLVRISSSSSEAGSPKSSARQPKVFSPQLSFTCVAAQGKNLYFGTRDGRLVTFNTNSNQFLVRNLCPGNPINALHVSRSRRLYATTSGQGLISMDLETLRPAIAGKQPGSAFFSIYEDRGGRIWLEPEKIGIVKYDPASNTFKTFSQKKDSHAVSPSNSYMVFEDPGGKLWTRLKDGGFGYYSSREDKIEYFYNEPGSSDQQFSNIVTAVYPDHSGILWLATIDGGVNKITFPGNYFNQRLMVKNPVNKSQNEVRVLFEDSRRRHWVGTKAGELSVFLNGKKQMNIFEGIEPSAIGKVYAIMEDSDGVVWLGTKGSGLLTATPLDASGTRYRLKRYLTDPDNPGSLNHNTVYSIVQDSRKRIWIGSFGGGINEAVKSPSGVYFRNKNDFFVSYPSRANYIRHLCEDSTGKLWIATTNGLVIADTRNQKLKASFKLIRKIPGDSTSLGNNEVQFIFRDRSNAMWLGTFGGGLNKLVSDLRSETRKFRSYTQRDGLPNDVILSIAEDQSGKLWVATGKGLVRFDSKAGTFSNYDSYDGLGQAKFSEAAAFRSFTGDMYFGCLEGYISFNPYKVANKRIKAGMALTNIQLYNTDVIPGAPGSPLSKSLNNTSHLELRYNQDVISIDYAVLDYRAGHKISYAYILRGYDKGWHIVGNQRKATYTNLPPGDYEFVVRSLNKDMFSNVPEKSIRITVLPPPWLTVWAYLVYILVALALLEGARRVVVAMIRLRNKVIVEKKMTDLKLQFFTNISHELRTPLTLIVSPLDEISRTEQISDQGKHYLHTIRKNADRMIRFVNQLLDFRKVQSGKMRLDISQVDVVSLLRGIASHFDGLAKEKKITLSLDSDESTLLAWLDPGKIDIVVYNILSNAFKFSPPGGQITIHVAHKEEDRFEILIRDQGPGVPEDKLEEIFDLYYEGDASSNKLKGTGIGLALSSELIRAHKGHISASNNPEGGMTFTLSLWLGKDHFSEEEVNFVELESPSPHPLYSEVEHVPAPVSELLSQDDYTERFHVLLVEDNVDLRTFMAGQLSTFCRVSQAGHGGEGLALVEMSMPDLIISDVMMPNMDGIQMLDQLKNSPATSHIPVILLTAKSSIEAQIEGLNYGADFYVTKPFDMQYLLALVRNFLKRRAQHVASLLADDKKVVTLQPDEILISSRDEEFVKQVIRIVETSMEDSNFNIDSVAEAVGFGRTTFYKKLKSLTGMAPVEFVREMRLKRSKQLLDAGEYTISEVAYMTGFKSSGYFSTCFREKFKQSPSAYLKSVKEDTYPGEI